MHISDINADGQSCRTDCHFTGDSVVPTTQAIFTHCIFSAMSSTTNRGAAICSISSSLTITLTGCVLKDCTAAKNGGAIYLSGSNSLTVINTLFQNCVTNSNESEPGGGGIFISGKDSSLTLSSSIFLCCRANVQIANRGGGALFTSEINTLRIFSSHFIMCSTRNAGGAIFAMQVKREISVCDALFRGNTAGYEGGAIREGDNVGSSNPHLTFSFLNGNIAPAEHGNDFTITPEITSTPFLYSFSTAPSNRVAYSHGTISHNYDNN